MIIKVNYNKNSSVEKIENHLLMKILTDALERMTPEELKDLADALGLKNTNGIKAEATANTEMILVADVDIDLLRQLNRFGSVRNLNDRRKDIFELRKTPNSFA